MEKKVSGISCHENRMAHRFDCAGCNKLAALVIGGHSLTVKFLNFSAGGFLVEIESIESEEKLEDETAWLITEDEKIQVRLCHQVLNENKLQIGLQRIRSIPRYAEQHNIPLNAPVNQNSAETNGAGAAVVVVAIIIAAIVAAVMLQIQLQSGGGAHQQVSWFSKTREKVLAQNKREIYPGEGILKPFHAGKASEGTSSRSNGKVRTGHTLVNSDKSQHKKNKAPLVVELPWSGEREKKVAQAIRSSAEMIGGTEIPNLNPGDISEIQNRLTNWLGQHRGEDFIFRLSNRESSTSGQLEAIYFQLEYAGVRQLAEAIQKNPDSWNEFMAAVEQYVLSKKHQLLPSFKKNHSPIPVPTELVPGI